MPSAFAALRQHARRNTQRGTDAARAVVEATLTLDARTGNPDGTRSPIETGAGSGAVALRASAACQVVRLLLRDVHRL
jgi:methylase of polypeptide subunit release factors